MLNTAPHRTCRAPNNLVLTYPGATDPVTKLFNNCSAWKQTQSRFLFACQNRYNLSVKPPFISKAAACASNCWLSNDTAISININTAFAGTSAKTARLPFIFSPFSPSLPSRTSSLPQKTQASWAKISTTKLVSFIIQIYQTNCFCQRKSKNHSSPIRMTIHID